MREEALIEKFRTCLYYERLVKLSNPQKELFCRFASAVHDRGLDWYGTLRGAGELARFGRKEASNERAKRLLGAVSIVNGKMGVGTVMSIGVRNRIERIDPHEILTLELLSKLLAGLTELSNSSIPDVLLPRSDRIAHWPDEY